MPDSKIYYEAEITETTTGKVRRLTSADIPVSLCRQLSDAPNWDRDMTLATAKEADRGVAFFWTDGNMGCDCNLHILFHYGEGMCEDFPCGNSAYSVRVTRGGQEVCRRASCG